MTLSDGDIRQRIYSGDLEIEPYESNHVEPASVDLRLGNEFKVPKKRYANRSIDLRDPDDDILMYDQYVGEYKLFPGDFVLATTKESVTLPDNLVAKVTGRSSLGRLGLSIHQTAGFIDPGFEGQITLELSNHGPAPVLLAEGARICQIIFTELSSPAEEPYGHDGSQYQGQTGATESGLKF